MKIDYLRWYKNLATKIHGRSDLHMLLDSSVCQPTDLLFKHLKQFTDGNFKERLNIPGYWGHQKLIENIASRYDINTPEIAITRGVSNAIYLTCQAFLVKGDHVVIESPAYEPLVASPDFIDTDISYLKRSQPDYLPDLEDLNKIITSKTKLILLTNLHNPSSSFLENDYLLEIARVAKSKNENVKIIVDEVYRDFIPNYKNLAAKLDDCFISLNSLTKVYGLGAIHCGWVIASNDSIARFKEMQTLAEGTGSHLLESFTSFILEKLDEYHRRSLEIASQNRALLKQLLKPLWDRDILSGKVPEYGCIYFPDVKNITDTRTIAETLADEYNIYIVPGRFFGEPGHIRIGFGNQKNDLEISLKIFVEAIIKIVK